MYPTCARTSQFTVKQALDCNAKQAAKDSMRFKCNQKSGGVDAGVGRLKTKYDSAEAEEPAKRATRSLSQV